MSNISKEEFLNLAKLAKLNFDEEEIEKYINDLKGKIDLVNQISEIDTKGVKETAHVLSIQNVFRKDEMKESFDREEILKNAPSKDMGCISVPKVVE